MGSSHYSLEYFNVTFPIEYVAHVEINRPEKLNTFKQPMWKNFRNTFDRLSQDANVRCVVLSGAGDRAFSAGLDVEAASADSSFSPPEGSDPARTATRLRRHVLELQDCVNAVERCEKPVIVVLHSYAYGLAIDISTAADIRICAEGTQFCIKEVDIGVAADVGTLTRLPKIGVCLSWAKEMAYTASVFTPAEALRVGFVSHVLPSKKDAITKAMEIASVIVSKSPVAVQGSKALLDWSRDRSVEDGLKYTAVWNSAMIQAMDMRKAMLSGVKRTKPSFEKL